MSPETHDFPGVEILSVGGPVHGKGSPPEGDHFSTADLENIATATRELMAEGLKAPLKVGHSKQPTEQPAAGWLENVRVSPDGSRLLADLRRVSGKVAEQIRSGGFRSRSVELARITSQRTGRTYQLAVKALALLGVTTPAVRGLADIAQLYEEGLTVELVRAYEADLEFAEIFTPDDDAERFNPEALYEALRTFGPNLSIGSIGADRLLVHLTTEAQEDDRSFIVPYRRLAPDRFEIAPQDEWKEATQAWVEVMTRDLSAGESIIDAAVRTGRIDAVKRDRYTRTYAEDPDWIVEMLARFEPDPARAYANTVDPAVERAYMDELAHSQGIRPEELI